VGSHESYGVCTQVEHKKRTNSAGSQRCKTLYSQYIYSLVLYTINNKHLFDTNNEIHKYRTRNNNNLHHPIANLSKLNISGIKVFNYLPQYTG